MAQVLILLACVVALASATFKSPPPSFNGCYNGRFRDGGVNAQAVFDMGGVTGYVQFYQMRRGDPVQINVNLEGLDQYGAFYPWHAHEFPVRDSLLKTFPCSDSEVGGHYDPLNAFGRAPDYDTRCNQINQTECEVGDFSGKLGRLRNDQGQQYFVDENLDLFGPFSPLGRALVIHYPGEPEDRWICANIEPVGCRVKNLRAEFNNDIIQGEVVIRHAAGQDSAKIYVDLFQVNGSITDRNKTWTIHFGSAEDDCGREIAGDLPDNAHDFDFPDCTNIDHRMCRIGDLTAKCDPLPLRDGRIRLCCTDTQLGVVPFETLFHPGRNHYTYLRIADEGADTIDGCARFNKERPLVAKAKFNRKDILGTVLFYQGSPLDRTFIQPAIEAIRRRNISIIIREGAAPRNSKNCTEAALGPILSTPGAPIFGRPLSASGIKTGDASLLGNLQSAIPVPPMTQRYTRRSSSHYAPLFGPHSVVGHTLVVLQNVVDGPPVPIACGTIELTTEEPQGTFASFTGFSRRGK